VCTKDAKTAKKRKIAKKETIINWRKIYYGSLFEAETATRHGS